MASKSFVMNVADVELQPSHPPTLSPELAEKFGGCRIGFIGPAVGAEKLGYNITAVPPGRRAFPFHNHRVNEEMFFILEGEGSVRIGSQTFPVKQGDIIACPAGGPERAHQIINTSDRELRYLAVSTKLTPEIAEYPDSNKFGVLAQFVGPDGNKAPFRYVGRAELGVDYYDGESEV
jgi:uncharacterized cupin superfamily protein